MAKYIVEDTSLTSVADAIRTKSGIAEALEFPAGFVSAVEGISAGGGGSYEMLRCIVERSITELNSASLPGITVIGPSAFRESRQLLEVTLPDVVEIGNSSFLNCTELLSVYMENATIIINSGFQGCSSLEYVVFPKLTKISSYGLRDCKNLKTVVLHSSNGLCQMLSTNVFNGTPFASGGTGGTVYVPAALIESYQTATNWSSLYAAGTCNFVAIEGSEYE